MARKFIKNEDALALVAAQNERLEQRVRELESQLANPPLLPNELTREAAFELLNTFPEGDAVDYVLLTWNECRTDALRLSSNSESVKGSDQLIGNLVKFKENTDADMCRKWAWEQVKKELATENWAAGEDLTFYGFFCWGWDSRRQYNNQRAISAAAILHDHNDANPERIKPMFPKRDKDGCWRHPHRLTTPFDEVGGTDEQYAEWYGARGMETKFTYMTDAFCECCASGECAEFPALHWNPEPPAGNGWVLTLIFDTVDGVCAEWIRYTDAGQANHTPYAVS
ncbi:hypothetical protein HG702_22295 (plasmid) [Pectobacterium versatile]|nr:hypothetical protein HG702_22295 [Pectobacterium versatile]